MIYKLDKLNAMADGDQEFVLSVLGVFIEETPIDVSSLEKAINEVNYEQIGKMAHKIKPNLELLGMDESRQLALDLENLGKTSGNLSEIKQKFPTLKKDIDRAVIELKRDFELG